MVISLKWKDRTLMAAVARITQNMIAAQDLGVDRALTAMEAFSVILEKQPFRDPNGDFADIDGVISRLKALMAKKGVEPTPE